MRKLRSNVRKILRDLELETDIIKYLVEAVVYCKKNNISEVDLNLDGEIYPYLVKKFNYTSLIAIRAYIGRRVSRSNKDALKEIFNYEKKITTKKLLILLLEKLKEV